MEQKLAEILQAEHISKVVYVDNVFEFDDEKVKEELCAREGQENFPTLNGWNNHLSTEEQFDAWWGQIDNTNKSKIALELQLKRKAIFLMVLLILIC